MFNKTLIYITNTAWNEITAKPKYPLIKATVSQLIEVKRTELHCLGCLKNNTEREMVKEREIMVVSNLVESSL